VVQRQVVDMEPRGVCRYGRAASRHFRRGEIESQSVPTWLKMDKSFEVRLRHGPLCGREVTFVMIHGHGAIQRLVRGFANLTVNEQDLLVHLFVLVICLRDVYGCSPKIRLTRTVHAEPEARMDSRTFASHLTKGLLTCPRIESQFLC
jgi:hypothetical protein